MRTQVAIIGAGPAGLLLGHLLKAEGVECVVLERRTPDYVLSRIRAGVLEQVTVGLMERLGLDARLKAEGLPHDGFNLADGERLIRIDIAALTGQQVVVYGQTELTRDLMDASDERGLEVIYEAADVALHDIDGDAPYVTFSSAGARQRIDAASSPVATASTGPRARRCCRAGREFERVYPFGWLGILADVPPCNHELIYANHERGFALASMRSAYPQPLLCRRSADRRSRTGPTSDLWDELAIRLGPDAAAHITRGPAIEKSIAPLRSYVFAPMRHGSLLLCGDAAHIVPPTGRQGAQSCRERRALRRRGADRVLQAQRCDAISRLFGQGACPRVEVGAVQLVADPADAPLPRGRTVRARDAGRRARLHRLQPRRADQHRRELRRAADLNADRRYQASLRVPSAAPRYRYCL
jgi:p-hydroxybenzoate 3-monooxygenase